MAIIKHLSIKNSNYDDAYDYLVMQHDEFTMKPVLDEYGRPVSREEYIIEGINCEPFSFGFECKQTNLAFKKNQNREDVKAHHYIISFDPRDKKENGLTMEQAQKLGLEFAKKNFLGHQILVCTHPDGHNNSSNIHVHIVINSVRKLSCERKEFMERPTDAIAGFKHRASKKFMAYIKQDVMNMCQDNSLYQVDLNAPAKVKVTDREYWASKRGQHNLDKENSAKEKAGIPVEKTKYETDKDFLRATISSTIEDSSSMKEFAEKLFSRYGISVNESRGRINYTLPGKNRPIRGRQLGTNFEKEYLKSMLLKKDAPTIPEIRFVTNLENNIKAKENAYYARKAKVGNLKQMAMALAFVQDNNIESLEALNALADAVSDDYDNALSAIKSTENKIRDINLMIKHTGQYLANKSIYKQYQNAKNKDQFRETHRAEIVLYEEARKFLKEKSGSDSKLPSLKVLKAEKARLTQRKNELYESYSEAKARNYEIQAVQHNIDIALGKERNNTKDRRRTI